MLTSVNWSETNLDELLASGHSPRQIYAELMRWASPVTNWELELIKKLDGLPRQKIQRISQSQADAMRLQANNCHSIAKWYVKNDLYAESKVCRGWIVVDSNYILHSVIKISGVFRCITPPNPPGQIVFAEDRRIEERPTEAGFSLFRGDRELPFIVRRNPQKCLDQYLPAAQAMKMQFALE